MHLPETGRAGEAVLRQIVYVPAVGGDTLSRFDAIAAAAAKYASAKAAVLDQLDPERADQVLRARVALGDCLIAAGWHPDVDNAARLELDRRLLGEPSGAIESADAGWLAELPTQAQPDTAAT